MAGLTNTDCYTDLHDFLCKQNSSQHLLLHCTAAVLPSEQQIQYYGSVRTHPLAALGLHKQYGPSQTHDTENVHLALNYTVPMSSVCGDLFDIGSTLQSMGPCRRTTYGLYTSNHTLAVKVQDYLLCCYKTKTPPSLLTKNTLIKC